jgi:hypothetical protein
MCWGRLLKSLVRPEDPGHFFCLAPSSAENRYRGSVPWEQSAATTQGAGNPSCLAGERTTSRRNSRYRRRGGSGWPTRHRRTEAEVRPRTSGTRTNGTLSGDREVRPGTAGCHRSQRRHAGSTSPSPRNGASDRPLHPSVRPLRSNAIVHPPGPLQRRGIARNKNAAPVGVQRLVRPRCAARCPRPHFFVALVMPL